MSKRGRAKKPAAPPKTERANKKAEVIALMKRAKGATPAEIMKATGWQRRTVRGFISVLGKKAARRSNRRKADRERIYKMKCPQPNAAFDSRGASVPACVGCIAHPTTGRTPTLLPKTSNQK